jgi:hypothetical protein
MDRQPSPGGDTGFVVWSEGVSALAWAVMVVVVIALSPVILVILLLDAWVTGDPRPHGVAIQPRHRAKT